MKKIAVIFNGGTISMEINKKSDAAIPSLKGNDLISMVSGLEDIAEIETYDFSMKPSPQMTPELMMDLSSYIENILKRDDIDGAVVTHGTDTMEETAYLLDLTINSEKPIVVTGAMRTRSELIYDGPQNLFSSIVVSASDKSRSRGTLLCFNNKIHLASEVTKFNAMDLDAFKSINFGKLGIVDGSEVLFYRDTKRNRNEFGSRIEPKVGLIKAVAGDNSDIINFMIDNGTRGLVIEAMGRGNLPSDMLEGVERAIKNNIPVVIVSRCPSGRVNDTYGYEGGGKQLINMGCIFADFYSGVKARIKLMLALATTKEISKIKKYFEN